MGCHKFFLLAVPAVVHGLHKATHYYYLPLMDSLSDKDLVLYFAAESRIFFDEALVQRFVLKVVSTISGQIKLYWFGFPISIVQINVQTKPFIVLPLE